jgi:DNA-3-methyladenine glycosylase
MKKTKLKRRSEAFFCHPAEYVAKNILGDYLTLKDKNRSLTGKIVETEAYLGLGDDASHGFKGKITSRNAVVYRRGGVIYVYLIYGKFWCFNIVVSGKNDPQSVFIRALEPVEGIKLMQRRRRTKQLKKLTAGPCRWTQSFSIDRTFWGQSITSKRIFLSRNPDKKFDIVKTKRVGVDYALKSGKLPLRFYIKDNPFVSLA